MMLWLLIGGVVVFLLLGGMRAFERASVRSVKSLAAWIAALGGLSLALLLILTGRGGMALGALAMFGPLVWRHIQAANGAAAGSASARGPARRGASMTRAEAFAVLGLAPGASDTDIKEAHIRLMRTAHPDVGGSDWIATRINQARDVLLG